MSSLYEALSPVQKDLPWLPHLNHHNHLLKDWMIGTTFSKAGTRKEKRSQSFANMTRKRIRRWQSSTGSTTKNKPSHTFLIKKNNTSVSIEARRAFGKPPTISIRWLTIAIPIQI